MADEARRPAATGADLRDDEERGEDSDEDDRRHQAAAEDPVARRGGRGELALGHAPVDDLREDDRPDDDHGHEQPAFPDPHGRSIRRAGGRSSATEAVRELALNRHIGAADSAIRSQRVAGGTSHPHPGGGVEARYGRLERLAARESLVQAVPEADLVLAQAPAKQHVLSVAGRGKVDEAGVEVLDECAQPRGSARHTARCRRPPRRAAPAPPPARAARRFRRCPQSASSAPTAAPGARRARAGARPAPRERTHLDERLVRLLNREVPLLHARMIRPL